MIPHVYVLLLPSSRSKFIRLKGISCLVSVTLQPFFLCKKRAVAAAPVHHCWDPIPMENMAEENPPLSKQMAFPWTNLKMSSSGISHISPLKASFYGWWSDIFPFKKAFYRWWSYIYRYFPIKTWKTRRISPAGRAENSWLVKRPKWKRPRRASQRRNAKWKTLRRTAVESGNLLKIVINIL